jgi:hypothetical protein
MLIRHDPAFSDNLLLCKLDLIVIGVNGGEPLDSASTKRKGASRMSPET